VTWVRVRHYELLAWCNACNQLRPWRMGTIYPAEPWRNTGTCLACGATVKPTLRPSGTMERHGRNRANY